MAVLRAITRLNHPDGPRADIYSHTASVSPYALAPVLTSDLRGDPVSEGVSRAVHMIAAGKPQRREARRDWLAWELERLGHAEAAHAVASLDFETGAVPAGGFPLNPGAR
jgi:hypothetical protein